MPTDLPPLTDIVSAFVFAGALFVLRFQLALHRLRRESGMRTGFDLADFARVRRQGTFGEAHEPERRHAARQLYVGFAFLVIGLGLFAWHLAQPLWSPAMPGPGLA
ncbi:hypothetical protein [Aureimonas sp. AU40]|uniref:hypothetical protein n=1 Tax=Aureimonas sp. AU40 TaxID=1637747 RepID=UPI0007849871|nr:hypothetical protein [Aureimonas sp. AU40]